MQHLPRLQADGALPADVDTSKVVVEPPRDPSHGDITTNAAMVLAKPAGKSPRDIAASLVERLSAHGDVESADIAGPGFVNMRIADSFWPGFIRATLAPVKHFGHSDMGAGRKINVEYVSANPTGPLHVGHCRGAVFGDALANLLAATGHEVTREYYINDAGSQIDVLAQSAYLRYREALGQISAKFRQACIPVTIWYRLARRWQTSLATSCRTWPKAERANILKQRAIDAMMTMIRQDLAELNIRQEVFFSENHS
jgi:arginyl-tRNA synthetase